MRRFAVKALRWWIALAVALAVVAAVVIVNTGLPSFGGDEGAQVSTQTADDDQLFVAKGGSKGGGSSDDGGGGGRGPRHPKDG